VTHSEHHDEQPPVPPRADGPAYGRTGGAAGGCAYGDAAAALSARAPATGRSNISFYVAIGLVMVFLVLKRSAAYAGFPPLYGGEIALIGLAVLYLRWPTVVSFARNPVGQIALAFAALCVPYIIAEYDRAGTDCIMFASVAYYALFVYFGYAVVSTRLDQDRFISLLFYAILASTAHFLLGEVVPLRDISPDVNGAPLLGNSDSAYVYFALGLAYVVIYWQQLHPLKIAALLTLSVVGHIILDERGSLLGIIGVGVVLLWKRQIWWHRPMTQTAAAVAGGAVLLFLLIVVHAPDGLIARKAGGQLDLLAATVGNPEGMENKVGTKEHRLAMWRQITDETIAEDPWLGQGFSRPLIKEEFRNPHNSFVTIFGRMGVVGLGLAVALYIGFPAYVAWRFRRIKDAWGRRHMLFYLAFVPAFLGAALFGPTLESPYSALVVNFMYGAFLRCRELSARSAA